MIWAPLADPGTKRRNKTQVERHAAKALTQDKAYKGVHDTSPLSQLLLFNIVRDCLLDSFHISGNVLKKLCSNFKGGRLIQKMSANGDIEEQQLLVNDALSTWKLTDKELLSTHSVLTFVLVYLLDYFTFI